MILDFNVIMILIILYSLPLQSLYVNNKCSLTGGQLHADIVVTMQQYGGSISSVSFTGHNLSEVIRLAGGSVCDREAHDRCRS